MAKQAHNHTREFARPYIKIFVYVVVVAYTKCRRTHIRPIRRILCIQCFVCVCAVRISCVYNFKLYSYILAATQKTLTRWRERKQLMRALEKNVGISSCFFTTLYFADGIQIKTANVYRQVISSFFLSLYLFYIILQCDIYSEKLWYLCWNKFSLLLSGRRDVWV